MLPPGVHEELAATGLGTGAALATEARLAPAGPGEAAAIASMPGRRRSEFLAGRLAARRALRSVGLDCGDVPRAGRRPLFPPGRAASISHSAGVAVAVARAPGHDVPLGCDLELRPLPAGAAPLVLRADEEHLLRAWPVTSLFSAKEAAWKALAADAVGTTLRDLRAGQDGPGFLRVEARADPARVVRVRVVAVGPGVFSVVLGGDAG
ncbi:enterobactin synthetase [Streptomyces sp. NPDC048566]|uniref:enterobactin synthetase n=1 Tax=Streptomyces sp. NPDC048566 TaxID=3365569 RepID=UPI00371DA3AA